MNLIADLSRVSEMPAPVGDDLARLVRTLQGRFNKQPVRAWSYSTVLQSIPDSTVTALTFNTPMRRPNGELYDTGGFHSTTIQTSRFTIPPGAEGTYLAIGGTTFVPGIAGFRVLQMTKNGSYFAGVFFPSASAVNKTVAQVSGWVEGVAGDYFELTAFQVSGGALNVGDVTFPHLASSLQVIQWP